jgi:hypothetical protein
MSWLSRLRALLKEAHELDTGNDGYVVPTSNSDVLPIADSEPMDSDATAISMDGSVVIDLPSIPSSMNEGNAAAPITAAQTKGLMMFNFNHTEEELRFIIQAVEAKIAALQSFLQKLITTANAQAQIQNGQPAAAANANPPVGEADAAPVGGDSADAGASTATA